MTSNLGLLIQLEVRDARNRLVRRTRRKVCRSYVRAMAFHLRAMFGLVNQGNPNDTGGTGRTFYYPYAVANAAYRFAEVVAASADANYGIHVGTGVVAVALSDYVLGTKIAHGTGAGQLQYGAHTLGSETEAGSTASFTLSRTFVNTSGGSITVQESGMVCETTDTGGILRFFLLARDLTGAVVVANGQTLTVTYTIKVTV